MGPEQYFLVPGVVTMQTKLSLILLVLPCLLVVLARPGSAIPEVCQCCQDKYGLECSPNGATCQDGWEGRQEHKLVELEAGGGQCDGEMCPRGCCPEKCWYCCDEGYCAATAADCDYSTGFL